MYLVIPASGIRLQRSDALQLQWQSNIENALWGTDVFCCGFVYLFIEMSWFNG